MSNEPDDDFEPLLRDYLGSQLDPHVGRAETAFRAASTVSGNRIALLWSNRGARYSSLVLAAAASLFLAAAWRGWFTAATADPQRRDSIARTADEVDSAVAAGGPKASKGPVLVERLLESRIIDEGIVYLDAQTPARKLRHQRLERREWYDPVRGARVQQVVPREDVQYVAIPSS